MNDLRILFTSDTPGEAAGYRAQLADAKGRRLGVEVPFTPFLTEDDYEDLRWYLEDYMDLPDGGAVVRATRIERDLEEWGHRLYEALFTPQDNRAFLQELLAGPAPRRLTVATRDPVLLRLPWELMADAAGSLAQRLSVRRQLEEPAATEPRPAQLPLRILYIVSRPADAGFLDPRFTAKALLDALTPLGAGVRVDFCRPPTLARMEEMLRIRQEAGDPFDIVHFDGHGTFLPKEQVGGLCFEKATDPLAAAETDFVSAVQLGDLLERYAIPLVILEACRSATMGKTLVFGSIAAYLIRAGVGSVLAMSHAVHVETTRLLLEDFYRELAGGATTGHALAAARRPLQDTPARWIEPGPDGRTIELRDWFLPQLYQRDADEALVPAHATADAATSLRSFRSPATREEAGSFPPAAVACPPRCSRPCKAWPLPVPRRASRRPGSALARKRRWRRSMSCPRRFPRWPGFFASSRRGRCRRFPPVGCRRSWAGGWRGWWWRFGRLPAPNDPHPRVGVNSYEEPPMKLEDLKFEALKLSIDDRAELVQALDMSLEEDDAADAEHERLWKAEIERRCRALDEGRAELIPAEVVFRRARAALQ